ncbi:MAG TPA: hypothetical protein VJQ52_14985 [Steroidobacteraceae bacterium]|nr:hypothetical protein [Steroidobacteraceae bacterium]
MGHWTDIPYEQRSDVDKIRSQWTKLSGHHSRTDWSASVVRAATACELAVNLAVRREFAARSQLSTEFVDGLLYWANGLPGKVTKLLLPLLEGQEKHETINALCNHVQAISAKRNAISHQGAFCSEADATVLITCCQQFVEGIVTAYEPTFELPDLAEQHLLAEEG